MVAIKKKGNIQAVPSKAGSTDNISANIKVAVRVRPANEKEKGSNSRNIIDIADDRMLEFDPKEDDKPFFYRGVQQKTKNFLKRPNKQLKFMFDNVFGPSHKNIDVFSLTTKSTISSLMEGFNCSVFVYGATGAGKTYTMIGSKEEPGITYLTMDYLFTIINSFEKEREFDICVSYLEVYNENVFDLLTTNKAPLQLREDSKYGVVVAGLTINSINTARELLDMLEKGNKNRTQHPTDANAESSRSHAVFQVYVKMKYRISGEVRLVKLSMIDLAGSERASATGCVGERFKEGANINRSLLSLGNCINKLADGCKYIPYRDSKLTRLLKDSLGGNCQTVMIANISPSSLSYEDTYNTLKYAARANNIQMNIKKNIVDCNTHVAQYVKIIDELKREVAELKAKMALEKKCIVVKKEPDLVNVKDNSMIMIKWRKTIEEEYHVLIQLDKKLLGLLSQQKVLAMRQRLKHKTMEQLSSLCDDTDDENLAEVNQKDVPRQEMAIEHFTKQISMIQRKLHNVSTKRTSSKNKFDSICSQARKECSELQDYIDKMNMSIEVNLLRAKDEHMTKLLLMQQKDSQDSESFQTEMPQFLRKLYLILKGYGKVSDTMTEKYMDIMKKSKNSRMVSWLDEQDVTNDVDPQLKFITTLNFDVEHVTPLFVKKEEPSTPLPIVLDSDSDIENKPKLKRKATPRIKIVDDKNQTVLLDDSMIEKFNQTSTLTPSLPKKQIMGFSKIDFEIEKDTRGIDPKDLNSTFVLAGKAEALKANALKGIIDGKSVLKDKSNFNVKLPDRGLAKVTKPIVGRAVPFRRPLVNSTNPTPLKSVKPAFGSSVSRNPFGITKPRDIQVGYKAVRARDRPQPVHPYTRPTSAAATNSTAFKR